MSIDFTKHGFRRDRFNEHWVSPRGNVVDEREAERIILLDESRGRVKQVQQKPPDKFVKQTGFEQLRKFRESLN